MNYRLKLILPVRRTLANIHSFCVSHLKNTKCRNKWIQKSSIVSNKQKQTWYSCLIVASILFATFALVPIVHAESSKPLNLGDTGKGNDTPQTGLILFYNRNCHECQRVLEFLPGFLEDNPDISIVSYDIENNTEYHDLLHQYSNHYGKPDASVPVVFVGEQELIGYDEITSGLAAGIAAARINGSTFPLTPIPTPAAKIGQIAELHNSSSTAFTDQLGKTSDGPMTLTFILFYNRNCHECQRVLEFLPDFLEEYPDIAVVSYDIADSPQYRDLFQQYNDRYGRPFSTVPAVFVGDRELVGYDEITSGLAAGVADAKMNGTTVPVTLVPTEATITGPTTIQENQSATKLTVPIIVAAALIDGINPCAFAVLVFLLVTLLALESRRRVLTVGVVYTLAVFVFYFLSGMGLFAIVQVTGLSMVFSIVAAVVALVAGFLMFRDALGTKSPLLAIPESRKATIETYIRNASLPAAFVLGVLVGIFELPCTGGIYLAILSLMSRNMSLTEGIPYLLLYNIVFIVPLLLIIAAVSWGLSPERLATFREENRRLLRFGMAVVMVALAIFLLFTAFQ